MDLLKRELERKKKNVEKAKSTAGGRRFFRTKDFRQLDDGDDDDEKEPPRRKRQKMDDSDDEQDGVSNNNNARDKKQAKENNSDKPAATKEQQQQQQEEEDTSAATKMSPEEITERLRSLGYPVKLFGESSWDRLKRLQKALDEQKNVQAVSSEMDEYRLGKGHGIRNPFLEKEDNNNNAHDAIVEGDDSDNNNDNKESIDKKQEQAAADLQDENDPHRRVYRYFKNLINQWEDDLALRPESVKKSVAGRNETKTEKQCKDYIRPLFKLCKRRNMDESILNKLNRIVTYCLEEDFVKAHDTYIDISIGRAAWPIGVTMVGIHARTGRSKIESSNVAHVMNSELQRKYLTSVKRLMSYAQKKSSADPSRKVMN